MCKYLFFVKIHLLKFLSGVLMDMQDFCFAAEIEDIPDVKLSDEHEEYKWCSYIEAKEYLKWEYNLNALEKLWQNCFSNPA